MNSEKSTKVIKHIKEADILNPKKTVHVDTLIAFITEITKCFITNRCYSGTVKVDNYYLQIYR